MGESAPIDPGQEDRNDTERARQIFSKFLSHSKKYRVAIEANPEARRRFNKFKQYKMQLHDLDGLFNYGMLRVEVDREEFVLVPRKINLKHHPDLLGPKFDRPEANQEIDMVMAVAKNSSLNESVYTDRYMVSHVPDEWVEKIANAVVGNEEKVSKLVNDISDKPIELDE